MPPKYFPHKPLEIDQPNGIEPTALRPIGSIVDLLIIKTNLVQRNLRLIRRTGVGPARVTSLVV